MKAALGIVIVACCIALATAQRQCERFTYPPNELVPTIYGRCGAKGYRYDADPEYITGTGRDDIIDGSPPLKRRVDRPRCVGVHEKIRGNGGDDIIMVDRAMSTTGIDWRPGEGDRRAWYPYVTDADQGDMIIVYDSRPGEDVVNVEYIAELYRFDEDNERTGRQSGTFYVMKEGINPTKVARVKYDCGRGYQIWWRPCNSDSGYCTAQYCDRRNNRVIFPVQCVPDNWSPRRNRRRWASYDGFYEKPCSCNKGRCRRARRRRGQEIDPYAGPDAGCCGNNNICRNFPDSLEDSWSFSPDPFGSN